MILCSLPTFIKFIVTKQHIPRSFRIITTPKISMNEDTYIIGLLLKAQGI